MRIELSYIDLNEIADVVAYWWPELSDKAALVNKIELWVTSDEKYVWKAFDKKNILLAKKETEGDVLNNPFRQVP